MSKEYKEKLIKKRAAHDSGPRKQDPNKIVLHSTEGSTAAGAASWFANPASAGSAHIAVDSEQGFRCVPDDVIAWGAFGANDRGLHMEHAAFAAWKRTAWLTPKARRMLRRSAYHAAKWCDKYDIPVRYLSVQQIRNGEAGICTHAKVSDAFHSNGHWDPGTGFPLKRYKRMVKQELRKLRK